MPFVLTQIGRTFVFVFTFTIPFVVTGEHFDGNLNYVNAAFFVILLTYGFLGLEFVSRMLSNPFGGEIDNDFNIWGELEPIELLLCYSFQNTSYPDYHHHLACGLFKAWDQLRSLV